MRRFAMLLPLAALAACGPTMPPGERLTAVAERGAPVASEHGVILLAEPWPGAVDGAPLLVTVINKSARTLRLDSDLLLLAPADQLAASGGPAAESLLLTRPLPEGLRGQALPEGSLKPGETALGVVGFRHAPRGSQLLLRLVEADGGAALGSVTAPVRWSLE